MTNNTKNIDFNCDLAQSFGVYKNEKEYSLLKYVSSVNISSGFHAGDPVTIREALLQAKSGPRLTLSLDFFFSFCTRTVNEFMSKTNYLLIDINTNIVLTRCIAREYRVSTIIRIIAYNISSISPISCNRCFGISNAN